MDSFTCPRCTIVDIDCAGGKKVKEAVQQVTIKKGQRGGRKVLTFVEGLDSFGIKYVFDHQQAVAHASSNNVKISKVFCQNVSLDDAATTMKKKLACGCSAKKNPSGTGEIIEIQGDFEEEIIELLTSKLKVSEDRIFLGDNVGNVKGRKKVGYAR
tara:strand:+ start:109 stop:576 length:468 start_codon:yes stop_codon:yes gene_type:complete